MVEPSAATAEHLRAGLSDSGFEVVATARGKEGLQAAGLVRPDIVLANLTLPDMSSTDLGRALAEDEATVDVPLIVFQLCENNAGQKSGDALEFLVDPGGFPCPISLHQLVVRAGALARPRAAHLTGDVLRAQLLHVDTGAHRAFVSDDEVPLTAIEFRLLVTLMCTAGRVLSRDRLLRDVWGVRGQGGTRTIDTHIKRLRHKLGPAGVFIETVRNVGYRFGTKTAVNPRPDENGFHAGANAKGAAPREASASGTGASPRGEAS